MVNLVTPGVQSGSLSAVPQISAARCTWTLCSGQHIKALQDRPPHSWTVSCSPTEHLLISENNRKVRGFHTATQLLLNCCRIFWNVLMMFKSEKEN